MLRRPVPREEFLRALVAAVETGAITLVVPVSCAMQPIAQREKTG